MQLEHLLYIQLDGGVHHDS